MIRLSRWARAGARATQTVVPTSESGLVLLLYHLVGAQTGTRIDLPFDMFREQMEEIAACCDVLSLPDAISRIQQRTSFDRLSVVLTFDDAYENFATHAWPVLDRLSLPATLYVPLGFLSRQGPVPIRGTDDLPPISWAALRELTATRRLTVGSHSTTHCDLRRLDNGELRSEILDSKHELEERLGVPVETFAYPRGLWDRRVEAVVRCTYASAVVAGGRRNSAKSDPHRLSRLPIHRGMTGSLRSAVRAPLWVEEAVADLARRRLR